MFEEAARRAGVPGHVVSHTDGWVWEDTDGSSRGWAGPIRADRPAWSAAVVGFELDVEVAAAAPWRFTPLPEHPPVERDVALVLPDDVHAKDVERIMDAEGGDLLESATVFDEFRGADITGRSVAWHLVFRAPDRTLRDEEVDAILRRMLETLRSRLHVKQRT